MATIVEKVKDVLSKTKHHRIGADGQAQRFDLTVDWCQLYQDTCLGFYCSKEARMHDLSTRIADRIFFLWSFDIDTEEGLRSFFDEEYDPAANVQQAYGF